MNYLTVWTYIVKIEYFLIKAIVWKTKRILVTPSN